MHHRLAYLALLALLAAWVKAECPPMEDVKVMWDEDTFNCARMWMGTGADHPVQGCNACTEGQESDWDYFDEAENAGGGGGYFSVGSLMVLPGCTFYGFDQSDFLGGIFEYSAGTHSNVDGPNGNSEVSCGPSGFASYKCRCQQKLISCVPEDGKWLYYIKLGRSQPLYFHSLKYSTPCVSKT